MQVKLPRAKIKDIYAKLNQMLNGGVYHFNFNYALIKNKNLLEKHVVEIDKMLMKIDEERISICVKYCKKDKDGKPVLESVVNERGQRSENYSGLKGNPDFDEEIKQLSEKRESYLKTVIEIEAYSINTKYIPQSMKGIYQESLMPFIELDKLQQKLSEDEFKVEGGKVN